MVGGRGRRSRYTGSGPSGANATPMGERHSTGSQAQRPVSPSPGQRSQHQDEAAGHATANARRVGATPPPLYAQSPHPCNDTADPTCPSEHHSVDRVPVTSTSGGRIGHQVTNATRSASEANGATEKHLVRKREEESDTDAPPSVRKRIMDPTTLTSVTELKATMVFFQNHRSEMTIRSRPR